MKKHLIFFIILIVPILCLFSCNSDSDTDDTSVQSDVNVKICELDVSNVNNFKSEITIGQTDEHYVLEGEKAKELYNIIIKYDRTNIDGIPAYSSTNPSKDCIYLIFSGGRIENSENPAETSGYYGWYTINTKDIVSYNLSPLMSASWDYQFEDGVYSEVKSYIENEFVNKE